MNQLCKKAALPAAILIAMASQQAFATNGAAAVGIGQAHKAMGGAATGNPINTMSMAANPASASFIDDGYDVGIEYFKPERSSTITGTPGGFADGNFDGNATSSFLIPEGGYKRTVGQDSKHSVGIVAYGAGGQNADYNTNPFAAFGATGSGTVDLAQLFISPTYSYKINDNHSIGASANLVYQTLEADGIQPFAGFSSDPTNLTNNGKDSSTGISATIGWQGQLSDKVTAGASYRTETEMGKLDKYKGLIPNQGKLNVPAALAVGMSVKATPKTTVAVDLQRVYYSSASGFGGNIPLTPGSLGTSNGPGFAWEDINVIKLGVRHQVNPKFAIMAGVNHGDQPVRTEKTALNMLAPGVTEDHLTLGGEWKVSKNGSVTASFIHTFKNTVNGHNSLANLGIPGEANLTMEQNAIGIGYSKKF